MTELDAGSRRLDLDDDASVRRHEIADTHKEAVGIAADPDVAVEQQYRSPGSLARQRIEDRPLHDSSTT